MASGGRSPIAVYLLFVARFFRMFSYGLLMVILYLFLLEIGMTNFEVGVIYSATMVGDIFLTFILTTRADSCGRRRTLVIGAVLKLFAGITFVSTTNVFVLVFAGTIGVITPSGREVGPFQPVEQAALTEIIERTEGGRAKIARLFGVYQLVGSTAGAMGALSAGWIVTLLHNRTSLSLAACYRVVIMMYAVIGAAMSVVYWLLPKEVEASKPEIAIPQNELGQPQPQQPPQPRWFSKFGLRRPESRAVVFRISLLFILDAFAGGFILPSIISAWFRIRWGMSEGLIGSMLMGGELLAGLSAMAVTPLVSRFGAIHTMVATHSPSHIFLILIPFMPTATSAVVMLLIRASISQMDTPARQAYVAMVVEPDERSAAGGITNLVRSIGLALSPLLASIMLDHPHSPAFLLPFLLCGSLKFIYDICMFLSFRYHDVGQLPSSKPDPGLVPIQLQPLQSNLSPQSILSLTSESTTAAQQQHHQQMDDRYDMNESGKEMKQEQMIEMDQGDGIGRENEDGEVLLPTGISSDD